MTHVLIILLKYSCYYTLLALLANDATTLQSSLNCLSSYCTHWKLKVNIDKSKIVVFSKTKWKITHQFIFNGSNIGIENSFKYLGVFLNYNWSFTVHKKYVVSLAQKAMETNTRQSPSAGRMFSQCPGRGPELNHLFSL